MKKFRLATRSLGGAALLVLAGMASAVNIVQNPSFELGIFDDVDINSIGNVTQVGGSQSNTKITN